MSENRVPAGVPSGGQYSPQNHRESGVSIGPNLASSSETARWDDAGVQEGSRTPWGAADFIEQTAPGISRVATPGHGGVKLSAERNRVVPPALRNRNGWYEEDCEAAVIEYFFPAETARPARGSHTAGETDPAETPQDNLDQGRERVRDWFPDGYEKATGENIAPGESHERDRQQFNAEHANDLVVHAAATSDTEPGMVEVWASAPADRREAVEFGAPPPPEHRFLVHAEEYRQRGQFDFVVDPERHREVTDMR